MLSHRVVGKVGWKLRPVALAAGRLESEQIVWKHGITIKFPEIKRTLYLIVSGDFYPDNII